MASLRFNFTETTLDKLDTASPPRLSGLKTDTVLSQHLLVQRQQYKSHLYCSLWTDFTHYSGISIVEFEKVQADWVIAEDSRARTESLSTSNTII